MRRHHVSRLITASPERLWALLTDAEHLGRGGYGILRIEGQIRQGASIKLWAEISPKRAFSLVVSGFDAPSRMEWQDGLPLGLFRGTRVFTLTPEAAGTTRFEMTETYTGPLAWLITKAIPDLQPEFEKFADALKTDGEMT